ncbi:MAG: hypothetical protein ACREQ8_00055 [Woeseiaceae bacterium]
MKTFTISAAVLFAGCATSSPNMQEQTDRQYLREEARIETTERFERFKKACSLAGGVVLVHRQSSGRQPPTVLEMRMATCGARPRTGGLF